MTETFYIVREGLSKKEDGTIEAATTYPADDLTPLFKAHDMFAASLEEWTERVVGNDDVQAALKISVKVASREDLDAYGDEIAIFGAHSKARNAKAKARAEEVENRLKSVEYFSQTVTTSEEAKGFFARHGFGAYSYSQWIEDVEKETGFKIAPEAAKALTEAWVASALTPIKAKEIQQSSQYKKALAWTKK